MATDYLLEIDGIKGESKDDKHPDTIEIDSFSWGNSNPGSAGHGGGGGAGKVQYQDVHFSTQVNISSPKIKMACDTGQHIKKAQLFVRKQGEEQKDYYVLTFEDFIVSSYSSGGSSGSNHLPTDQFAFNFSKMKFEYSKQKDDGGLEAPITSGWDLQTNKKYG